MKEDIIRQYFDQITNAKSPQDINSILDQIIPVLKLSGISVPDLIIFLNRNRSEYETKSQDNQNTISNSNKAKIVIELLMAKLNK